MKNPAFLIVFLIICIIGCKTTKPVAEKINSGAQVQAIAPDVTDFSEQSTWLLGFVNPRLLAQSPHAKWYLKGFDEYGYNSDVVKKLTEAGTTDLKIKIVFGTWCPDSRREVPRFMRILTLWKFPDNNVQFIGVDNAKISPVSDFDKLEIQRVPTFIFYKNNIEVGRIIENPSTSLEQDIVNILIRKN